MTTMTSPFTKHPIPLLFLFLFLFHLSILTPRSFADPRTSEAALICGTRRAPDTVYFVQNFVGNMAALSDLVSSNHWGTHLSNSSNSSSSVSSPVYGLAQCHSDLSDTDCLFCFAECRTKLPHCLPNDSARVFLDGCFLRYDVYDFYLEPVDPVLDRSLCGGARVDGGLEMEESWRRSVVGMLGNLTVLAAGNGGFGVWEAANAEKSGGLYGLAECWKTVGKEGCRECLEKAGREVEGCLPAREGRGLNAGCYLRYSDEKFYGEGVQAAGSGGGRSKNALIIALVSSVAFVASLSLLGVLICYKRLKKTKEESKRLVKLSTATSESHMYFNYEMLEKATDYFDPTKKLGQGGAGSVYKGTLPDGTTVAVKRLFFNTRQWADEFFNEVNLISKVEHKNLVKLLGCSIEGPESLLVYEYIPNKSLDRLLFDRDNIHILTWQQRFQIIVGVGEGLAYLHGGPETRIIHRDIKCSNILLDENLNARIADFGLARRFSVDQTHLSTGIAGTLGYMAPEYLVRGLLTEKADVYSFGVLVLEIVCGRKNSVYAEESSSVIQMVWKHFTSKVMVESVDHRLRDNIPAKEASDVLQVGLLCTQASIVLRPSMDAVVQMLTTRNCVIPLPTQPPFLNASSVKTHAHCREGHLAEPDQTTQIKLSLH